jgi:hypothetical protein
MTMSGETLHKPAGSRRPRLWELEHKSHCPIVGVCFDVAEIRKLVLRLMTFPHRPNDFELHVTAVQQCEVRTPLSSLLQKKLERKYGLQLQRSKAAASVEQLREFWRAAVAAGDVAGTLWAVLSHAACSAELTQEIYGDIHMLQHQVGAGQRVEQRRHLQLQRENAVLGRELAAVQQRFTEYRAERANELEACREQLAAAKVEVVQHAGMASRAAEELDNLRRDAADPEERLRLNYRLQAAEAEATDLRVRIAQLGVQLGQHQADNRRLERELMLLAEPQAPACGGTCAGPAQQAELAGRTVLCVGGLGSATPRYRSLVEVRGGEFVHHDGGLEENLRRLESVIAAADAVICQTGCISHNAYWRVKEQCKRSGKQCNFVGNPSLSSFLQTLDDIARQLAEQPQEVPGD